MIGKVSGRLVARHPPQIIVDVQGIGYEIDVPMSTFYALPATGGAVFDADTAVQWGKQGRP